MILATAILNVREQALQPRPPPPMPCLLTPLRKVVPHLPDNTRRLVLLGEALTSGLGGGVRGVSLLVGQASEFAGGGGGLYKEEISRDSFE